MKLRLVFAFVFVLGLFAGAGAEQVPFGIVYGPKAAFNIAAPEGWVIDNSAGAQQGLPCVLYRKGEPWESGDPVMYAKIASTSVVDAEAFAKAAVEDAKKKRGEYKTKRVESGKTKDGHAGSSTNIRLTRSIRGANESPTYSCRKRLPTSFTPRTTKQPSANIRPRWRSCCPPSNIWNRSRDASQARSILKV
ncbi:MAG: hypothetical protein ACXV9Q_05320 [Chthoniobacterales bacterium]